MSDYYLFVNVQVFVFISRFTKYELKKKIKTNQMKINTLYNK